MFENCELLKKDIEDYRKTLQEILVQLGGACSSSCSKGFMMDIAKEAKAFRDQHEKLVERFNNMKKAFKDA